MLGAEKKSIAVDLCAAIAEASKTAEDLQKAISATTFAAVGLDGRVPEKAHHAHITGVHKGIRAVAKVTGFVTGTVLDITTSADAQSMADHPRGAALIAGADCAFGDSMSSTGSALATDMAVRARGRAVPLTRRDLRKAFPVARPRIVVFIHGLGGTEFTWGQQFSYADHLGHDLDLTTVMIRYNSGRRIHENGADFDRLLTDLVREWPTEVASVDIVAHSMGGLITRSACAIAEQRQSRGESSPWLEQLDHICYLGAPNYGAPAERFAHNTISTLGTFRIGAPLARLANRRSAGIKDLRHGTISATDTAHGDADRREIPDHQNVPLAAGVRHHFVSTTVLPPHYGKLAHAIGDYLVQPSSALADTPSGNREPLAPDRVHRLAGKHHNNLLRDDDVYRILVNTLAV
ncbi:MAG: alpha/beta fold hydrolase [Actinomycetes bacterium]